MLLLALIGCGLDPGAVAKGIASGNPAVREDMVIAARQVDDPAVVEALHKALADPAAKIRAEAAESLGLLGHVESVPPLLPLLDDPEAAVRRAAVGALGQLGDLAAVEPLLAYVERRPDDAVPLDALWALGALGDPRAMPVLSGLREDPDPYVAFHAGRALREIGDKASQGAAPEGAPADAPPATPDAPAPAKDSDAPAPAEPAAPAGEEELPPPKVVPWPGG